MTDAEWPVPSPFLPPHGCCCPRKWEMREIVNAIFYVLCGGIAWSLLPEDLPPQRVPHDQTAPIGQTSI